MLDAETLSVTLGRKPILKGIDLEARAGTLTCIVGPNGSGKTTLLRALTGEVASSGRLCLDGQDLRSLKPEALALRRAVLPQSVPLAFPFTVLEIVRLGLTGVPGAEARALPSQALHRVGLGGYEGRLFQELSGGEQQRVHLARVLLQVWQPVVHGLPRWLFLDEPVAALDIGHQLQVMRIARDFAEAGGGVIAVMHDLNLTAMVADQVWLMTAGRIAARGSPAEVFTDATLAAAYGCAIRVSTPPSDGTPFILPQAAA